MTREEYKEIRIKTQAMVREISNCSPSYKRIFFAGIINLAFFVVPLLILWPIIFHNESQSSIVIFLILIITALLGIQLAITIIFPGKSIGNIFMGYSIVYQNTGLPISRGDYFDLIIHRGIDDIKYNDYYEFYDQISDPFCRTRAMRNCGMVYAIPYKLKEVLKKYKGFKPVFASYEEIMDLEKLKMMNRHKKND